MQKRGFKVGHEGRKADGKQRVFRSGTSASGAAACARGEARFAGQKIELEIGVEKEWHRSTLAFGDHAMRVHEACTSLTAAADLLRGMVFKVAEGVNAEANKVVIGALPQKRRTKVKAAAADMNPAIWPSPRTAGYRKPSWCMPSSMPPSCLG